MTIIGIVTYHFYPTNYALFFFLSSNTSIYIYMIWYIDVLIGKTNLICMFTGGLHENESLYS